MYIYILRKKENIFYVGRTINIQSRYRSHLLTFGNDISMDIIYEFDIKCEKKVERFFIIKHLLDGHKLINKGNYTLTKYEKNDFNLFFINKRKFKKIVNYNEKNKLKTIKKHTHQIPSEILSLSEYGDISRIYSRYNVNISDLKIALASGRCSKRLFVIVKYYLLKRKYS